MPEVPMYIGSAIVSPEGLRHTADALEKARGLGNHEVLLFLSESDDSDIPQLGISYKEEES